MAGQPLINIIIFTMDKKCGCKGCTVGPIEEEKILHLYDLCDYHKNRMTEQTTGSPIVPFAKTVTAA